MHKLLAALALSAAFVAPAHADVTVGTADTASTLPFSQYAYLGGYYFQQVYSAASFGSGLTIDSISFFKSADYAGSTPNAGDYRFYLGTTNAAIATFGTNTTVPFADPSYTEVYSGKLPALDGNALTIDLTTSFDYDPAAGNLLLTIFQNLDYSGDLYVEADTNNPATNIRFSAYPYAFNQGLVTQFGEAAAVPEPATWAMMIGGMGLAGGAMRRRRTAVSFA